MAGGRRNYMIAAGLLVLLAIGALRGMRARLKDPKYTVSALVLKLEGQGLLQTADFLREYENLI
mgnify:CR=1 FL=1